MGITTDNIDEKYRQVLEEELRGLQRRREHDSSCTIDDLKGILKNLYIFEGNNWDGRSELMATSLAATIAAYERFITDWEKESDR